MKTQLNLFIALTFLSFVLVSCATVEPVTVTRVDNFQVTNVLTNPAISFDVVIHNPNSFGLTLVEFKSSASLGDKVLTDIFTEKNVRINPAGDVRVPLQTTPSLKDITSLFLSVNISGNLKVEGYVTVKKFLFRKKFPFLVNTKI